MLRSELEFFKRGLIGIDVAVSAFAFLVAFHGRQWLALKVGHLPGFPGVSIPPADDPTAYHLVLIALVPLSALIFYWARTSDFRASFRRLILNYAQAVAVLTGVLVTVAFLFKLHFVARSFVLLYGGVNFVFLIIARYALLESAAFLRQKRHDGHRVLIVGTDQAAINAADALRATRWNIKLLGHLSVPRDEDEPCLVDNALLMGDIGTLDLFLDRNAVDEVLFTSIEIEDKRLATAIAVCEDRGVEIVMPMPVAMPTRGKIEMSTVDGISMPFLSVRRTPTDEFGLALKRILDIGGSIALIIATSPIMIATAIGIKLGSKGPVFFQQVRCGRNGRKFTMFKFRSMVQDAESLRADLDELNEMSGPVFKMAKDPRVTRIGALIRRTSIDELPQLFNILAGQMSLVGPRPPLPDEVEKYEPWQRRRLSVKPGLTGLWQVSGRNNIDFDEWMQLDLRYIDTWSLWQDIKILLRTLPAVVNKTGAS